MKSVMESAGLPLWSRVFSFEFIWLYCAEGKCSFYLIKAAVFEFEFTLCTFAKRGKQKGVSQFSINVLNQTKILPSGVTFNNERVSHLFCLPLIKESCRQPGRRTHRVNQHTPPVLPRMIICSRESLQCDGFPLCDNFFWTF